MIFYFSGTGNTEWAAQRIAKATGERLVKISDERGDKHCYNLVEGERIGFCFPIHGWQPPRIMRNFIESLELQMQGKHFVYAVCTCGDTVGNAIKMLRKLLVAKGLHLDSAHSLVMPESYVCLPFMYTDTPEREASKIDDADRLLNEIETSVRERKSAEQLHKGKTPWIYSHIIGEYFNRRMITDKPFTVDADVCLGCGKCADNCPTGNLRLSAANVPEWHHDYCTCCLACYHHCPVHAINYGKTTRKRGQYYFKG